MAGVARVDITPQETMWMAGYAARDHAAEGTFHPLWLKALVLQDAEGNRCALLTSDILGFPKPSSDRIRDALQDALGLDRSQIILSASHTHSGPVIDSSLLCIYPLDDTNLEKVKKYTAELEKKAVKVVKAARCRLQSLRYPKSASIREYRYKTRT